MGVAERKLQAVALQSSTVANANELELLLVALVDANDHVVDERTGKAVECLGLTGIVRTGNDEFLAFLSDGHHGVELVGEFALGALRGDFVTFDGNGNSGRNRNGLFADTRHSKLLSFPYQMYAITSPPTPALRASRSAMTPLEVDTIAVPRPPRTRGSSSLPA